MQNEIIDRFGTLPNETLTLLQIHKIRIQASKAGIRSVRTEGDQLKYAMAQGKNKYFKIGSRFPRLTQDSSKLRLTEIYNFIKQIEMISKTIHCFGLFCFSLFAYSECKYKSL